jgi:DNA-binding NtrC family response regulator
VAARDIPVLITGERGTGTELAARALHDPSARSCRPYMALNCAAIPGELIESELFGHERGAFTSAVDRHLGVVERAHGSTLFLDEIGELGAPLQAKLLRVLQERRFTRVGGTEELRSDFRLIGATNRNLLAEVRAGRFREDLYFRIAVFEVEIPPLRERNEDVLLLAQHFIDELTAEAGRQAAGLTPETEAILLRYPWPGNVRELRNTIERALVVCDGDRIAPSHLPPRIREPATAEAESGDRASQAPTPIADRSPLDLGQLERSAVEAALERTDGNLSRAARLLGISRTTLYRKLKSYAGRGPAAVARPRDADGETRDDQ